MIALAIYCLVLLSILYITALYINWRSDTRPAPALSKHMVYRVIETISRNTRRGMYFTERVLRSIGSYGYSTAEKIFLKIFPNAKSAFKDRDLLTGLSEGPSSYFLMEISKAQIKPKNRSRRTEKSMQQ